MTCLAQDSGGARRQIARDSPALARTRCNPSLFAQAKGGERGAIGARSWITRRALAALRAFHPTLEPRDGVHVRRRVHAFGLIARDVDELGLAFRLVEVERAIGGVGDALVALADGESNAAARRRDLD